MTTWTKIKIAMFFFLATAAQGHSATNELAIYLPRDIWVSLDGTVAVSKVELDPVPVVAAADFVTYTLSNHTFEITPAAAKRLARKVWEVTSPGVIWSNGVPQGEAVNGNFLLIPRTVPFVMTASGEPVYLGVFQSPISSVGHFEVPNIDCLDFLANDGLSNNVKFSISSTVGASDQTRPDVRNDPRLVQAVNHMFSNRNPAARK